MRKLSRMRTINEPSIDSNTGVISTGAFTVSTSLKAIRLGCFSIAASRMEVPLYELTAGHKTSPARSGRPATASCPVMPRISATVIPPIGFEPVSLPTLGRGRQHRPGLHLQLALLTGLLVFAGPALRVVSHPYVVDAPVPAAEDISVCRALAAGGPALSTLSISSHWRVPFFSPAFTLHKLVITSQLIWHVPITTKSQAALN